MWAPLSGLAATALSLPAALLNSVVASVWRFLQDPGAASRAACLAMNDALSLEPEVFVPVRRAMDNLANMVGLEWPGNPVRQFQLIYCGWLALALLCCLGPQVRFLRWFHGSGLALAQKRGLGAHPCKLYGVFQPPTLSAPQLRLTGLALIACLLGACTPLFPRVFCFAAFLLSLCYFPQLFAEVTCSGHSTILIPSILFLLSCAPSLDHQVRSTSEWPLHLIRIYISVGYFSSGMCKLLCGARFNRFWGKGPTLQAYIFDGMWSRPAGPVVTWLQRLLLTSPWIATLLASGSVVFETGFILAPTSDLACLFLGLNGLAFHLGIYLLQGLDFATFWMPALFVFLVGIPTGEPWQALRARPGPNPNPSPNPDPNRNPSPSPNPSPSRNPNPKPNLRQALLNGSAHEKSFFIPAAIYTALQVLTALTLRDFWLDDILPFSCCPMFMLPRNPFDEWPKLWTMSTAPLTGSTRACGAMEPLYWTPASPIFDMPLSEARKLPQKVLWFGSTLHCPVEVRKFIHAEIHNQPFIFYANFEVSAELKERLRAVVVDTCCGSSSGEPHRAWDGKSMSALLDAQAECLRLFDECAQASLLSDTKTATTTTLSDAKVKAS